MQRGIQWWLFASVALMLGGAFGPWASFLAVSVSGADGSNDGWVVVGAALVGGGLAYATRSSRGAGVCAFLGGGAGFVVTAHDRGHVQTAINQGGAFARALVHVGWGLNLALAASISMAFAGVAAVLQGPPEVAELYGAATGECPYCKEDMRVDALVCPHCQREVTPLGPDGQPDHSAWGTVEPGGS